MKRASPVDAGHKQEEDEQKFVLDHLLYFFPGPYVMLSAFLDESGTDDKSPAMCVAGLLYEEEALKQLDQEWKNELDQEGIRYFHTVEEAHSRGEFEGKNSKLTEPLFHRLLDLLNKYVCGGMGIITLPEKEFDEFREGKWNYSQYTTCAYICMGTLASLARRLGHDQVSFVIESGHADMGELRTLINQRKEAGWEGVGPCQFSDKRDMRPLQTADVWAYELVKHHRNRVETPDRQPRKSLQSMIVGKPNMQAMVLDRSLLHQVFSELSAG